MISENLHPAQIQVEKIDPGNKTGFTRGGFLQAMCEAHGYRVPLERFNSSNSAS
jgi:hypothetical protein